MGDLEAALESLSSRLAAALKSVDQMEAQGGHVKSSLKRTMKDPTVEDKDKAVRSRLVVCDYTKMKDHNPYTQRLDERVLWTTREATRYTMDRHSVWVQLRDLAKTFYKVDEGVRVFIWCLNVNGIDASNT